MWLHSSMVEQATHNRQATGSNPVGATFHYHSQRPFHNHVVSGKKFMRAGDFHSATRQDEKRHANYSVCSSFLFVVSTTNASFSCCADSTEAGTQRQLLSGDHPWSSKFLVSSRHANQSDDSRCEQHRKLSALSN